MMAVQYKIIGAGSSSDNKIVLNAGCGVDSMSLCWTLRVIDDDQCGNVMYYDEQYCYSADTTSSGSSDFNWIDPYDDQVNPTREHTIYYTVVKESCPQPSPECTPSCLGVTAYAEPYYVTSGYSGNIDIHYECDLKCYVKRGVDPVPFSSFTESGDDGYVYEFELEGYDDCSTDVYLKRKDDEKCDSGETADISITFSEKELPAYSGSVNVIVSYRKTTTKEDCSKKTVNGYFTLPWTVVCESSSDTYLCCKDHYVTSSITVADIWDKAHIDSGSTIYYNGQPVTTSAITYSILQKAKYTDECSGFCEDKTTYCVDSGSVKVQYETSYMSDNWHDATDADILPFTGGRIKVIWDYTSYTSGCTSKPYSGSGEWEEIIVIGGCDERPTDCNSDYNKVITGYTSDNPPIPLYAIYDDETYQGCAICDSECCYECGSDDICIGKCVILFKEQTPSCTTCDYCDVWDNLEGRLIRYNKIRYHFKQNCYKKCETTTRYEYDKKEVKFPCDFSGTSAFTVSVRYSSYTEDVGGFGCTASTSGSGTTSTTYTIRTTGNNSHENIILTEDELCIIIQESGETCTSSTYCDCESLILESGSSECTDEEKEYTYGVVTATCEEHYNYGVKVPYTATCNGEVVGTGERDATVNVPCNTGDTKEFGIDGGGTLRQAGGCSCDGGCADGLVEDSTLNGYINTVINNSSFPVSVNVTDTPCTYKYLKQAYDYVKSKTVDSRQISWAIANTMSEITPNSAWTASYFENAELGYSGVNVNMFSGEETYNSRIKGAMYYAMFKRDNKTESDSNASKARIELNNKNSAISGSLLDAPDGSFSSHKYYTDVKTVFNSLPHEEILNNSNPDERQITQDYITKYQAKTTVTDDRERLAMAISDKNHNNQSNGYYYREVLGINNWSSYNELFDYVSDFQEYALGEIKWDEDWERWRPAAYQKVSSNKFDRPDVDDKVLFIDRKSSTSDGSVRSDTTAHLISDTERHEEEYYSYASCCGECGGGCDNDYCEEKEPTKCSDGCGCSDTSCTNYVAGDNDWNSSFTNCAQDCGRARDLGIRDRFPCMGMNSRQSFPSGHSSAAYMFFLAGIIKAGVNHSQEDRVLKYCESRVIVRAHWRTDVTAGKYVASMLIGFLNGIKQFNEF